MRSWTDPPRNISRPEQQSGLLHPDTLGLEDPSLMGRALDHSGALFADAWCEELSFTGEQALEDLDILEDFSQLKSLSVERCSELKSLEGLEACEALEQLSLVSCPQLQDLSSLGQLPRLKSLRLVDCPRADLPEDLSRLEELVCNDSITLGSLHALLSMVSLRSLSLRRCRFAHGASFLTGLPRLERLTLQSCPKLQVRRRRVELRGRAAILHFSRSSAH